MTHQLTEGRYGAVIIENRPKKHRHEAVLEHDRERGGREKVRERDEEREDLRDKVIVKSIKER